MRMIRGYELEVDLDLFAACSIGAGHRYGSVARRHERSPISRQQELALVLIEVDRIAKSNFGRNGPLWTRRVRRSWPA
jgi:hypothetical protein